MKGSISEKEASVSEETKDDSLVKPALNQSISKTHSQSMVSSSNKALYS
jgi:hypothetical protein